MKVRVCKNSKWITIDENTECYAGRCGSGHTVFGEPCKLFKVLANHLVFKTKSGSLVKTNYNMNTVGKAAKNNYWVGLEDRTGNPNYFESRVHYWNEKTLCFDYK